jgi:hypothetical protein
MRVDNSRPYSGQKTILDAFREHEYLKSRPVKNPSIPSGSSIISPKPPELKTYYTICNNGSRKIPVYYLGGRRVNALGFGLSDTDIQAIDKLSCKGCNSVRCKPKMLSCHSTSHTERIKNPSNKKTFPKPSTYYRGNLPPAPITIQLAKKEFGQIEREYYLDND